MPTRRFAALAVTSLALLALPAALAQAPALAPSATVSLSLPPGPDLVALGTNRSVEVQVTFTVQNVACPSTAQATVRLSLLDQPNIMAGISSHLGAQTLTFNVTGPAQYASAPFSQTLATTLSYSIHPLARGDHDHAFNVTASYDGSLAGCTVAPGSALPGSSAHGLHRIHTGPSSVPTQVPSTPSPTRTSAKGSPSLASAPCLAALALALALRRRVAP